MIKGGLMTGAKRNLYLTGGRETNGGGLLFQWSNTTLPTPASGDRAIGWQGTDLKMWDGTNWTTLLTTDWRTMRSMPSRKTFQKICGLGHTEAASVNLMEQAGKISLVVISYLGIMYMIFIKILTEIFGSEFMEPE